MYNTHAVAAVTVAVGTNNMGALTMAAGSPNHVVVGKI